MEGGSICMAIKKGRWTPYLVIHAIILAGILLFPLYRSLAASITRYLFGCFVHDFCFLYCPLCGGTRAVAALLRLDLLAALRYNAFVALSAVVLLIMDVVALFRLIAKKERVLPLPSWSWIPFVTLLLIYAVLRNYLMIAHGYDPTGDLGYIWNR